MRNGNQRLSLEVVANIAGALASQLGLRPADPITIRERLQNSNAVELTGEGKNRQIAWVRMNGICYLQSDSFGLRYAYATREAVEQDRRFAEGFRASCFISIPDVIADAANIVMREIGDADYWVDPAFRNLLTGEEWRHEDRCHVESPAAGGV